MAIRLFFFLYTTLNNKRIIYELNRVIFLLVIKYFKQYGYNELKYFDPYMPVHNIINNNIFNIYNMSVCTCAVSGSPALS